MDDDRLSRREREIARTYADGENDSQIAERLLASMELVMARPDSGGVCRFEDSAGCGLLYRWTDSQAKPREALGARLGEAPAALRGRLLHPPVEARRHACAVPAHLLGDLGTCV